MIPTDCCWENVIDYSLLKFLKPLILLITIREDIWVFVFPFNQLILFAYLLYKSTWKIKNLRNHFKHTKKSSCFLLAKLKIPKPSKSLQVLFLLPAISSGSFSCYPISCVFHRCTCVHVCVCLTVNSCSLEIHLKELGERLT